MKNIVLITVDCLRADHMSCYGYNRETTPFLKKLSENGLFFKNAFANGPNTRHSVPSFLTSTYPLLFLDEVKTGKFSRGRKSIAEVLKEKGYKTAAIHSNPYISKFYGYDRGFDYFNDFLLGQVEDEVRTCFITKKLREMVKGISAVFMHKLPHEDGKRINEEAFRWLEKTNEGFFLWLHYMDVHMPYVPSSRFLNEINVKKYNHIRKIWMGKKIDDINLRQKISDNEIPDYINLYDGCIRYIDWVLRELIGWIEKRYSNTIYIITADHGEEFREHGDLSHLEKLYDELLNVPLIFYGKDIRKNLIDKPVSLLSLAPTVLHFLNIKEDKWFQGKNIFEDGKYIIAEAWDNGRITAYRDERWKFILKNDKAELYDLRNDAVEKNNLYGNEKYKGEIKKFRKVIYDHIRTLEDERRKRNTWLQKEKIKRMVKKIEV